MPDAKRPTLARRSALPQLHAAREVAVAGASRAVAQQLHGTADEPVAEEECGQRARDHDRERRHEDRRLRRAHERHLTLQVAHDLERRRTPRLHRDVREAHRVGAVLALEHGEHRARFERLTVARLELDVALLTGLRGEIDPADVHVLQHVGDALDDLSRAGGPVGAPDVLDHQAHGGTARRAALQVALEEDHLLAAQVERVERHDDEDRRRQRESDLAGELHAWDPGQPRSDASSRPSGGRIIARRIAGSPLPGEDVCRDGPHHGLRRRSP